MNDKTTKSQVRSGFRYARHLMRLADDMIKQTSPDLGEMEAIANEMIAAAATFLQYVEDHKEEAEEKTTIDPKYTVQIPEGAWDQDEWNAYTR